MHFRDHQLHLGFMSSCFIKIYFLSNLMQPSRGSCVMLQKIMRFTTAIIVHIPCIDALDELHSLHFHNFFSLFFFFLFLLFSISLCFISVFDASSRTKKRFTAKTRQRKHTIVVRPTKKKEDRQEKIHHLEMHNEN